MPPPPPRCWRRRKKKVLKAEASENWTLHKSAPYELNLISPSIGTAAETKLKRQNKVPSDAIFCYPTFNSLWRP